MAERYDWSDRDYDRYGAMVNAETRGIREDQYDAAVAVGESIGSRSQHHADRRSGTGITKDVDPRARNFDQTPVQRTLVANNQFEPLISKGIPGRRGDLSRIPQPTDDEMRAAIAEAVMTTATNRGAKHTDYANPGVMTQRAGRNHWAPQLAATGAPLYGTYNNGHVHGQQRGRGPDGRMTQTVAPTSTQYNVPEKGLREAERAIANGTMSQRGATAYDAYTSSPTEGFGPGNLAGRDRSGFGRFDTSYREHAPTYAEDPVMAYDTSIGFGDEASWDAGAATSAGSPSPSEGAGAQSGTGALADALEGRSGESSYSYSDPMGDDGTYGAGGFPSYEQADTSFYDGGSNGIGSSGAFGGRDGAGFGGDFGNSFEMGGSQGSGGGWGGYSSADVSFDPAGYDQPGAYDTSGGFSGFSGFSSDNSPSDRDSSSRGGSSSSGGSKSGGGYGGYADAMAGHAEAASQSYGSTGYDQPTSSYADPMADHAKDDDDDGGWGEGGWW